MVNAADAVWAILLFALVLAMMSGGFYFLGRWRGRDSDDQLATHELLTNFREMHARGELTDQEYRTIKTRLATDLQAQMKSAGGNAVLPNGDHARLFIAMEEQLKKANEDGAGD